MGLGGPESEPLGMVSGDCHCHRGKVHASWAGIPATPVPKVHCVPLGAVRGVSLS